MKRLCAVLMLPFLFPDNKGILGFDERLHRVRETLQKEKDVHTVTHAQLEQYKVELACLYATVALVALIAKTVKNLSPEAVV